MTRRIAVALLVLAVAVAVPALALGDSSRAAANSQTYQDATGEDATAPDISTITVSNDDAGLVTFKLTIANRPTFAPDMLLLVFLDTTPGQGDAETFGADYAFQALPEGVALFRWDGSDYAGDTPQTTLRWEYTAGVAGFAIRATELGNTKQINFSVIAVSGITRTASGDLDLTNIRRDIAPAGLLGTTYRYDVKTTVTLTAAGFTTSPSRPVAGGPFSVALAAGRSDTSSLVRAGAVKCVARIGNTVLRATASRVRSGVAACAWSVPANAKGKTIRGSITLTVDGSSISRTFSARVG